MDYFNNLDAPVPAYHGLISLIQNEQQCVVK